MKIFKKFLEKPEKPKENGSSLANSIKKESANLLNFIVKNSSFFANECALIKKKCKNLRQTNYDLGMKHLDEGRISEATFRFYFTTKIWPNYYDAYYQMAYCLALDDKYRKAKKVLKILNEKQPNYDKKATELSELINRKLEENLNEK